MVWENDWVEEFDITHSLLFSCVNNEARCLSREPFEKDLVARFGFTGKCNCQPLLFVAGLGPSAKKVSQQQGSSEGTFDEELGIK